MARNTYVSIVKCVGQLKTSCIWFLSKVNIGRKRMMNFLRRKASHWKFTTDGTNRRRTWGRETSWSRIWTSYGRIWSRVTSRKINLFLIMYYEDFFLISHIKWELTSGILRQTSHAALTYSRTFTQHTVYSTLICINLFLIYIVSYYLYNCIVKVSLVITQ